MPGLARLTAGLDLQHRQAVHAPLRAHRGSLSSGRRQQRVLRAEGDGQNGKDKGADFTKKKFKAGGLPQLGQQAAHQPRRGSQAPCRL